MTPQTEAKRRLLSDLPEYMDNTVGLRTLVEDAADAIEAESFAAGRAAALGEVAPCPAHTDCPFCKEARRLAAYPTEAEESHATDD